MESLGYLLSSLLFSLLVLLAGREIVCWYFKINEMMQVIKSINAHLADIVETDKWRAEQEYREKLGKPDEDKIDHRRSE